MDIFRRGLELHLRFQTEVGSLEIEKLFTLSEKQLDKLGVSLQVTEDNGLKKTLIEDNAKPDAEIELKKLKFDIVNDILQGKVKERKDRQGAAEVKRHNERIDELIAEKKDFELRNLPIEELEKLKK